MTPQQITEAQRLAALLDESRISVPRMHAHEAAEFLRTLAAQTAQEQPFAWATHHDEPMLFPTHKEAEAYCDEGEEPIALYTRAALEGLK